VYVPALFAASPQVCPFLLIKHFCPDAQSSGPSQVDPRLVGAPQFAAPLHVAIAPKQQRVPGLHVRSSQTVKPARSSPGVAELSSSAQVAVHPSSSTRLPSSQASDESITPSPQRGFRQCPG
jgi:hypothetical protein